MRWRARIAAGTLLAAAACQCSSREGEPIAITVTRNGYEPWRVQATRGKPLVLVLTRTTDETCAREIVIPEAGINQPLPLGQAVRVTFTPSRTGEIRFSCAMKMFQGVIEVR